MSKSNRGIKITMRRIYGKGCMFKKAKIEQQLKAFPDIKGYRIYTKECRYTLSQIRDKERRITYHHLQHRSEGGSTTIQNGALIGELPHQYLHSLPRDDEEIIAEMLRQYKLSVTTFEINDSRISY